MFVVERMAKDLIKVSPEMSISVALAIMKEQKIRHLPITDGDGKLVGIVSDRDIRSAMPSSLERGDCASQEKMQSLLSAPLSRIMTKNPICVYVFNTIQDVLLVMRQHTFGALPVVDENGYLKGILSTRDLLRAFVNVMGIDEPGTLLCILSEDKQGQMKKIIDVISEEKISLGSVLVSKGLEPNKKAIFPYLLTNNVVRVKTRLMELGFQMLDPMQWYLDQLPKSK